MSRLPLVRKRDGRLVPFDLRRVADAIFEAARSVGGEDRFLAEELAGVVGIYLERDHATRVPGVEDVEQAVERVLVDTGHAKTAKAFVLRRDHRVAAVERLRIADDGRGGERPLPLVGSDGHGGLSRWSASRVASALREEAGLEAAAADEVAAAVEARVLSSGLARMPSSLVRALVDSELFARGHLPSLLRQRVVGVPKHDVAQRLAEGLLDRRAADPAAFAEGLGEEVLRPYVLEEVLPTESAEAHRVGDLHFYDLGAPLSPTAVGFSLEAVLDLHLKGEGVARAGGPRRVASALSEAAWRYGGLPARLFTLEDLNVHLAPFLSTLDEEALEDEARELFLSPAALSFPRRGGLLRLEWGLDAEVPDRLAASPARPPAPPGRRLGDYADASLRVARALLVAARGLAREGRVDRLPLLTVSVPRAASRDPAARALLLDALSLAAVLGEPRFSLDDADLSVRGTRWLRLPGTSRGDPLRRDGGDVSLATAQAVNVAGAALRVGPGRSEALFHEVDRLVDLALVGAAARREVLRGRAERPDGALWSVGSGPSPLLDLDAAYDLVEPVGVARAAAHLVPEADPDAREALRGTLLRRLAAHAATSGARLGLVPVVVEAPPDGEAASRLAQVDAARFDRAAAWWGSDAVPSYGAERSEAPGERRVVVGPGFGPDRRARVRIVRRVDTSVVVEPDELLREFERAASDPTVVEYALDPWPRRVLRPRS